MATPPLKRSRKSTTKRKEATVDINTLMFDVINGERKSLTELSNAELKAELIKCGEKPGPITDSTRKPYEKLLVRKLQNDQNDSTSKATTTITITGAKKTNASQNRSRASSSGVKRLTSKVFRPVIQGELNDGMKVSPITTPKQFMVEGLIADVLTPFHRNGDGITICHICSDAGEYKSLTIDERKAIVQEWARASQGKLQGIICNVSCDCLNAATELARFAQSVGVSAISCTCPSYGYKTRIATLTNYLSNISRDAPNIPLLYNHSEETIITSSTEPCNEVTVHKAMLTLRGLDIGIPRSPLQELSGDMMTKLKTEMAQLGIFTTDTIMQPTINLY
ncbi:uncharacterized protein TRIADDRAFT_55200 [Trichoplax adhaerens]|uniref:LEM domain-containing protein n=1 Tax=Trichoplax adhaerens TaxID=10228 RepID=B3RU92_TRIAD|nr:hypothetical protein TRIADDRAFT_55200 [Trichoplax adhaerens]EDV25769.1 hypothetical protein TRIADDRAFT_55200 [Trichoplax adhaerens]|eukprot:XP_002111802.1 hypothetical protein TRIADDRAFT_55200 [Trichoplax adhaerens]